MILHLGFHHFLDCAAQQVFEGFLDVMGIMDVVFLQQSPDDVALALCHYYFVYWLFFPSCHNNRPPYDN